MAVLVPSRRAPYRPNVLHRGRVRRPRSVFALFAALICRVPFVVQLALACVFAAALAAGIGELLGGAAAARDLGLLR